MSKPTPRDYLAVTLFWLAVSFFWGALLFVVLQSRVHQLVVAEFPSFSRSEVEAEAARRLGFLVGTGALIAAVTQVMAGAYSDHFHSRFGRRKPFLVGGVLLSSVGILALPWAPTHAALFVLFLYVQLTLNVATGPYQALLPELIPPAFHGTAAAVMGGLQLVGRTGGMVAGALLMGTATGPVVLTIVFLISLNGLMAISAALLREREPDESAPRLTAADSLRNLWRTELRSHPGFVWLLVSRFVINTGVYTMLPYLQYYLMHVFDLDQTRALHQQAIFALVVNLAGLVGVFPAGKASDRWSKKRVVTVTCLLCIIGGFIFAISGSLAFATIAAGIFGLGYGAFQAVDWALVCNVLPEEDQAKYMGIWSFADTLPQILAPALGGLLATAAIGRLGAADAYRLIMLSAVIWFAVGAICIGFVRERPVRPEFGTAPE